MRNPIRTTLTAATLAMTLPFAAMAAETYKTDQGHTEVMFGWSHVGVTNQSGEFTKADGTLVLDEANPENSTLEVTIDTTSLHSGFGPLDDHLKNDDFFGVDAHPTITFKSTKITPTGEKTADVTGDLTIRGVTKPFTLTTTLTHLGDHPLGGAVEYYQGKWAGFEATGVIENHQEFNVGPFPTGPIAITIRSELKKADG
ncbi:MAG: YceI family protein [Paracoccaceae bacterium]